MNQPLIAAERLTKCFGETTVVDDVTLTAHSGAVLALLGRNGAGKTTFLRMLSTLTAPTSGSLEVLGVDVVKRPGRVRQLIGLAGQQATVEHRLTGRENLEIVGRMYGLGRSEAREATSRTLDRLGLADIGDKPVGLCSGGQRRRLDLGATLVGEPHVLLLDEPTTGLDPASRNELWDLVRDLVGSGTDVILTTQYLAEAEALADRVVVLERGRVLADGSPHDLVKRRNSVVNIRTTDSGDVRNLTHRLAGDLPPATVDTATGAAAWETESPGPWLAKVFAEAASLGVRVEEASVRQATLEEAFIELLGEHDARSAAGGGLGKGGT